MAKKKAPHKKPAKKPQAFPLKLTGPQRETVLAETNIRGTLDTLHHHIQAVMEWTNSHMHHFWIGKKRYGRPSLNVGSLPEDHVIDSTQIRLSDILPANGKKLRFGYEYDFGDCWEHEIQFERVVKTDPTVKYPVCIEGERAGPPDTCGGVPGYEYLLEVLADPNHEEYRDMLEWAGHIDPKKFDPKRATKRMVRGLWA